MISKEAHTATAAPEVETAKKYRSKKALVTLARMVLGKSESTAPMHVQAHDAAPSVDVALETKAYTSETETKAIELGIVHDLMQDIDSLDTKVHKGVPLKDAVYRAMHEESASSFRDVHETGHKTVDGVSIYGDRYANEAGSRQMIVLHSGEDLLLVSKGYEQDFNDDIFEATQYKLPSDYEIDAAQLMGYSSANKLRPEIEQFVVAQTEAHYVREHTADTRDKGDALSTLDNLLSIQSTVNKLIK